MTQSVTYADFPTLSTSLTDKVVGVVISTGSIYCRRCMERIGMSFNGTKVITQSRIKHYHYNCCRCGWQLSPKRMTKYK